MTASSPAPLHLHERTSDRVLAFGVMFGGGALALYLGTAGSPPEVLGIPLDNAPGRALLVVTGALLLVAGVQQSGRILRRQSPLTLDEAGVTIRRFPRTVFVPWAEITAISPPETRNLGFGTELSRLNIATGERNVVLRFNYADHSPLQVYEALLARWRAHSG